MRRWPLTALLAVGLLAAACGTGSAPGPARPAASATRPAGTVTSGIAAPGTASPGSASPGTASPGTASPGTASGSGAAGATQPAAAQPLAGRTVGIDPGHNGRNGADPAYINRRIWNGREYETCDTTGTQTDGGYTEARFNFRVARYLHADLVRDGARVTETRPDNHGVGPCVTRRARIINRAHASVAIDIHADGGPASGRGFTVLEPVRDGPNDHVIRSSVRFGHDVRSALLRRTSMPESDYYGHDGLIFRDDLAGLNLTTVPKILIECGNMRNATDARLLERVSFQKRLARAFTDAIVTFLARR